MRGMRCLTEQKKAKVKSSWLCLKLCSQAASELLLEFLLNTGKYEYPLCLNFALWSTGLYKGGDRIVRQGTKKHQKQEQNQESTVPSCIFTNIIPYSHLSVPPYLISVHSFITVVPSLLLFVLSVPSAHSLVPAECSATSYRTSRPLLC